MRQFKYDISVVIPVYNTEKYLRECVESLINQKMDFSRVQVLLVDDGSTDDSIKIIEEFTKKYENICLLKQENSGVSEARNNGIKHAEGKYIMLLDSDDTLSKKTLISIFEFFEKNYEQIDIVTYPMYYNTAGRIKLAPRYELYDKGTAIYDVNEYIFLNQSTVNIVIKNEFENNILYNSNMKLSEDQKFDTDMIMKKEKIGFVKNAAYYYRRHANSVSNTLNNPYYCFEDIMYYNESLAKEFEKNGRVHQYVQSLILNTLKWRLKSDNLFPYHLDSEEYNNAIQRIKRLISKIDLDVILKAKEIDYITKLFLINFSDRKIKEEDKQYILEKEKNVQVFVNRFKIRNEKLIIMLDIASYLFDKTDNVELYVKKYYQNNNSELEKMPLLYSNKGYYNSEFKTSKIYRIDYEVEIENLKRVEILVKVDNKFEKINADFGRFSAENKLDKSYNIYYSQKDKMFHIEKRNILNVLKSRVTNSIKCFKKNKKSLLYRALYYFYFKYENAWVYMDKNDGIDNGYKQFINDFGKNDGIKKYYVCDKSKIDIDSKFTNEQKKYIINYRSTDHKMLFLHCKKIITSFVDVQVYCPFNTSINCYADLKKYDLYYLQHGILHANLRKLYAKEYTEIDKFVISTNFEKENLSEKYHYKIQDFIESGMPRMEKKEEEIEVKNKILFAPSWRKYLIGNLKNGTRELKDEMFINSTYFKEIYDWLHSEKLTKLLQKNNLILDFKLHPIFAEYGKYFELDDLADINLSFGKTPIEEYKIVITDFSSFQFDFVKLKRNIVYFLPDMKEFKGGLHSYRELDLDYKDAFGKLCLTSNELLEELNRILKNNFALDKKVEKRMDEFFLDISNPCEMIYDALNEK